MNITILFSLSPDARSAFPESLPFSHRAHPPGPVSFQQLLVITTNVKKCPQCCMISCKQAGEVGSNQQPINRVIIVGTRHMQTALVAAIRHSVGCMFLDLKQKRDWIARMSKLHACSSCSSCSSCASCASSSLEVTSPSCDDVVSSFSMDVIYCEEEKKN